MYLLSQLWWLLAAAFAVGALVGYWLWRYCVQNSWVTRTQTVDAGAQTKLASFETRHRLLDTEMTSFKSRTSLLETDLAGAKSALSETTAKWSTAQAAERDLTGEVAKLKADLAAARAATDDAARKHAEALKSAETAANGKIQTLVATDSRKHDTDVAAAKTQAEAAGRKTADDLALDHQAKLKTLAGELAAERQRHQADLLAAQQTKHMLDERPPVLYAARSGKPDDLKLIWGVAEKLEKQLNALGIYHFDQIAGWTGRDLKWFESHLGEFASRPERDKWIEQCRKLASGWRPDHAIGDKPAGFGDGIKPATLTAARAGKADDLKLIWGVGPKLELQLHKLGFYHFDQLGGWTKEHVIWVENQLGDFSDRVARDRWVEQAKKLATGWLPEHGVGDKPKGR